MKNILSNIGKAIEDRVQNISKSIHYSKKRRNRRKTYTEQLRSSSFEGTNSVRRPYSTAGTRVPKRRFMMLIAGALVAVMVPVIVVSANGNADQTANLEAQAVQQETVAKTEGKNETLPPQNNNNEVPLADAGALTEDVVTSPEQVADGTEVSGDMAPKAIADPQPEQQAAEAQPQPEATTVPDAQATEQPQTTEGAPEGEATPPVESQEVPTENADTPVPVDEAAVPEGYTPIILIPDVKSSEVIKLQSRLMELKYMDADEPTEFYGPATKVAVSYFQRKHGLPVDGIAGVETQKLLFSDEAKVYTVTLGADGLDVSGYQERLKELGYPISNASGYFGEETEKAVQYFQRMNGLTADGSIGQSTKDLLFSEEAIPAEKPKPTPTPEPSKAPGKKTSTSKSSSGSKGKGSSGGGGGSTSYTANPGSVQAFIDAAYAQVGKPYVLGGKGGDVFDCSGLVYYALQQSGNGIGYMTSGGWASSGYATVSSIGDLQPGDVICFTGHVGVYVGGGTMVDASSSNGQVVVRGLGSWAQRNFICGKRPL